VNEAALVRGLGADLHVRLADYQGRRVTIKVAMHPLVSWIWIGFLVMALGAIWSMVSGPAPKRLRRSKPALRRSRVRWALAAAAITWLVLVGAYLLQATAEHARAAQLSLWMTGAATLAAAGLVVWAFLPVLWPGRPAAAVPETPPTTPLRDWLAQEILQVEQDVALGKLESEEARAAIASLRHRMAVLLDADQASAALLDESEPPPPWT